MFIIRVIALFSFLVVGSKAHGQLWIDDNFKIPKDHADTLYFPYSDGIQLIIIDLFDTWSNKVAFEDMIHPRGGSAADFMGPPPKNIYIFRDEEGDIKHIYNHDSDTLIQLLKVNGYTNASFSDLDAIQDYNQLNNHLMIYGDSDKVGLVNLLGEIIIPVEYDKIRRYQDRREKHDKLLIWQNGLFGMLDSNLNFIFHPQYKSTQYYPEHSVILNQYIKVIKDGRVGLIDENGSVLIDFMFNDIELIHDTLFTGWICRDKDELTHSIKGHWNWGYLAKACFVFDKHFKVITHLEDYEYIYYFGIKRFIVKKNNQFGVLDQLGAVVVPLEYDYLTQKNGTYYVKKDNKWGIIDLEGKVLLPLEYQSIDARGLAIYVTQDGLIGLYNDQYQLIAKPQFSHKTWDMGKHVLTRADGTAGFVQYDKENTYYQSPEGAITRLVKD